MAAQPVSPLRIQKGSSASSPTKMPMVTNKPLSELSPMALRRNSPSFPQAKANFKGELSPAVSSPFSANNPSSPRLFWQERDPNSPARDVKMPPLSPTKRSSIENLKKASRVKNSSMFALEQNQQYDPSRPTILDGRPANNNPWAPDYTIRNADLLRKENIAPASHSADNNNSPKYSDSFLSYNNLARLSPSKSNSSPAKSSLSKKTGNNIRNGFDPETGIWEDEDDEDKQLPEGRGLHRHAKSVTFDQAPPQINEYEMTTPDPSSVASGSREGSYDSMDDEEEEMSFERGSSMDHDDSFDASLEDTEKTPVVLPEDWRFMSPDTANVALSQHEEDVFDDDIGSPAPTANPGRYAYRDHQTSITSTDSNGMARPLPPLPPAIASQMQRSPGRDSLSGTIERISSAQRSLPSPPQAPTISKSDIRRMSGSGLSMEDRIRLMMIQDQNRLTPQPDSKSQHQAERAQSKEPHPEIRATKQHQFEGEPGPEMSNADESSPRISREAILKHMRSNQDLQSRGGSEEYDPDVPIPSLEDPTEDFEDSVIVKEEEDDDDNGLYSIPDLYSKASTGESEVDEDDLNSQYSQPSFTGLSLETTDEGQETPRAQSPPPMQESEMEKLQQNRISLPDFMDFGASSSFNLGLETYMTPPSENNESKQLHSAPKQEVRELPDLAALRNSIQRPFTPEEQLDPPTIAWETEKSSEEPGTPDSVIRHPIKPSPSLLLEVPEHEATVRAPGSKLKIRPSLTKLDIDRLTKQDSRSSSGSEEEDSIAKKPVNFSGKRLSSLVPLDLPKNDSEDGLSFGLEREFDRVVQTQKVAFELSLNHLYCPSHEYTLPNEVPDTKDSRMKNPLIDFPLLPKPRGARPFPGEEHERDENSPTLGSFTDRTATRQRGYLMRQNTKVVVASERDAQDETAQPEEAPTGLAAEAEVPDANQVQVSPRKISQPAWTAEPWNAKPRRKSIRVGGEKQAVKRKPVEGTAPPLPGQASNVQDGLGSVAEDDLAEEEAEEFEDGAERGRLFVKVVGVKDLQLPLPQHEKSFFALTLDNGLHCVTTAWLDLARSAPIGQEFELVVLNELEFQLTLQMKLEEPKIERPASPVKPPTSPKKQGAFGRLFGSPKKKKEAELKAQQEAQAAVRPPTPVSAYDLVKGIVERDGSFARAYVALNEHEKKAYGRPYTVDITCFNEWAMEEVNVGSSRSKKNVTQLRRRPPYEIGKLELQLLYVPKPKGIKDEDMPKSMNGAVRAMREAEERAVQQANVVEFEGHLSQQGGDCTHWRRRFFKLVGPKLTAYHEATLQPRATINLAKATKLIDDKSALTQKETTTKGGGRRKSAFAEEEEGYMFIEEGFRIRFANGEVIDFYADSAAAKEEWMKVLSQVVGKGAATTTVPTKGWTEMVLKRERSLEKKKRQSQLPIPIRSPAKDSSAVVEQQSPTRSAPQLNTFGTSGIPLPTRAPPLPRPAMGHLRTESTQTAVGPKSQVNSPVKNGAGREERHRKTKSMLM